MSDALKAKMGQGQRPKFKDFTLKLEEGEEVALVIRRPTPSTSERLMRTAGEQGLLDGKDMRASPQNVLAFQREVVAATVYAPGALTPLYNAESAGECLYLGELFAAAMPALVALGPAVEDAKGN